MWINDYLLIIQPNGSIKYIPEKNVSSQPYALCANKNSQSGQSSKKKKLF